jgi:hypothetical protein
MAVFFVFSYLAQHTVDLGVQELLQLFSGVIVEFVLLAELSSQDLCSISFVNNYSFLLVRA